jgi:hypothetical protein
VVNYCQRLFHLKIINAASGNIPPSNPNPKIFNLLFHILSGCFVKIWFPFIKYNANLRFDTSRVMLKIVKPVIETDEAIFSRLFRCKSTPHLDK